MREEIDEQREKSKEGKREGNRESNPRMTYGPTKGCKQLSQGNEEKKSRTKTNLNLNCKAWDARQGEDSRKSGTKWKTNRKKTQTRQVTRKTVKKNGNTIKTRPGTHNDMTNKQKKEKNE